MAFGLRWRSSPAGSQAQPDGPEFNAPMKPKSCTVSILLVSHCKTVLILMHSLLDEWRG